MNPQVSSGRRAGVIQQLRDTSAVFDLVVIGGGITGAGIAREAAASGLKTLLIEQKDFAWGTSSRSSKMVHGGLRYLGSGHFRLTRDAVRERERLMKEAPGLIDPLRFVMPHFHKQFPGPRLFQLLLRLYDRIAGNRSRHYLTPGQTQQWVPGLQTNGLAGASGFTDAVTDDARLVQRLIEEARSAGATCVNYVAASDILRSPGPDHSVTGVRLTDTERPQDGSFDVTTALVINATGAWAGRLHTATSETARIRPLRGSHLIVPFSSLPVSCSVSLFHPRDGRPVFAFPWQGTTVLGTTDLDHREDLDREPAITPEEVDYLLEVADTLFPGQRLAHGDVIATWAGVRPVVSSGNSKAPSKENREHVFWEDDGLISIAGGKLTTFRLIAREALQRGAPQLPGAFALRADQQAVFSAAPVMERPAALSHLQWHRLQGFYGPLLPDVLAEQDLQPVARNGDVVWAEVLWACRSADVVHLDDLMLRRTRLGLTLADGGAELLATLKARCQHLLGWDDERWQAETDRYRGIWRAAYSMPETGKGAGDDQ